MRDEEENNPKILPKYKPSWLEGGKLVNSSWKVADLKAEAALRGLSTSGKKDELIERINAASLSASKIDYLSDEHFTAPVYVEPKNGSSRPSCYPEVYETPSEVRRLKESANQLPPPQK